MANFGFPLLSPRGSTPRGPAIPTGGPRIKPVSGGSPHRNSSKKGYTGTRAGIGHRGRARLPTTAGNSPHGPLEHPFSSTQLPARKRFSAAPKKAGGFFSLFRRRGS